MALDQRGPLHDRRWLVIDAESARFITQREHPNLATVAARVDGADLIVSLETRQWGTDYDPSRDFGQASMERRALSAATQSMAITLQPNLGGENEDVPSGTLRVAWGTVEYFTNWQILWP